MKRKDQIEKERNPLWKVFLNLRGLAIIGVMVAHSSSICKHHSDLNDSPILLYIFGEFFRYVTPTISAGQIIPGYCVPMFLFLAGYTAAITNQNWRAIGERIKMLSFPFFFWSLMHWAWTGFFYLKSNRVEQAWSIQDFLIYLITGETQSGYFFFILIFQWYILAHWIVPLIRSTPMMCIITAAIIQTICMVYNYFAVYHLTPSTIQAACESPLHIIIIERYIFILYPLYPILGMAAASYANITKKILDLPRLIYYLIALLSIMFLFYELGITNYKLFKIGYSITSIDRFSKAEWLISYEIWGLIATILLASIFRTRIPTSKAYQWLNKNSYTLFLLNGPCLLLINRLLWKICSLGVVFPFYFLFFIVLFYEMLAPYFFIVLIKKYLPKYQNIVIG
jgi:hypothetical protein